MVPPSMTSVGEEEKFQLDLTGGQFVSETKRRNVICFSSSSWIQVRLLMLVNSRTVVMVELSK